MKFLFLFSTRKYIHSSEHQTFFDLESSLEEIDERASRLVEKRKITETLVLRAGDKTRVAEKSAVGCKTLLT